MAIAVLIGWFFQIEWLLSLIPGAPTMKFNTAFLFVLSSTGILIHIKQNWKVSRLNYLIGTVIVLLSAFTLVQYITGSNFGLDDLLLKDNFTSKYPGRMSRVTSLCFILLGTALLITNSKKESLKSIAKSCLAFIALIAVLAFLTYILQTVSTSSVLIFKSMALHTAISFFILSLALSLSNAKYSYVDLLSGTKVGSKLARNLLPFLVILPLLLSFSIIHFVDVSEINTEIGITLYTIAYAAIALIYGSWVSVKLNREAKVRKDLEKSLIKANKELKSSILFKKQLVSTTPETIIILNLNDQNVRYINKDIYPEEGLTKERILGTPIIEIIPYIHPKDRGRVMEFHRNVLKSTSTEVHDIEIRLKLKGNVWEWFSVRGKIFHRRDESWVDEYVILVRNINKQKETQNALINAEKYSIMGEVARTLAHELRNPITSIGMATDVLNMTLDDIQKNGSEKYFKILKNSTKTLDDLVNNLLNSSNYGKTVLKKIDLTDIIDKTLEKAADRIYLVGIEIRKDYSGSHIILADSEKLEIALLNILVNASEAVIPDEGIINIEVIEEEKEIILRISDNGHGLEKEQMNSLFDAFYTTKRSGIGVGLNSVKTIVQEHDATIDVNSELNKGTSFSIFFPKID